MIPKTLFLYWGAERLSWLRYLTIASFSKFNPDWEIKVYYPKTLSTGRFWPTDEQSIKYRGEDWWDKLKEIPRVELVEFDMTVAGFSNDISEVHKSDIFRLWVLYEHGGLYSDFDILYYAPIDLKDYELVLSSTGHWSIGFIGSVPRHHLYKELLEDAKRTDTSAYQRLGSELWTHYFEGKDWYKTDAVWDIPPKLVYPFDWQQVRDIFGKSKFNGMRRIDSGVGLHWFGGNLIAGEWENILTPDNYLKHDILISELIKEILCSPS